MDILTTYRVLITIALNEFSDVVVKAQIISLPTGDPLKLRLDITDGSLVDVFISMSGRYSYHWERRLIDRDDLYRHDNAPHHRWRDVTTFPKDSSNSPHQGENQPCAEAGQELAQARLIIIPSKINVL